MTKFWQGLGDSFIHLIIIIIIINIIIIHIYQPLRLGRIWHKVSF